MNPNESQPQGDYRKTMAAPIDPQLALKLTDLSEELEGLIKIWSGYTPETYVNPKDEQVYLRYIYKPDERVLNQKGITSLAKTLKTLVNKNTFISDLSEDEKMNIIKQTMQAINKELAMNFDEFGLDVKQHRTLIIDVMNFIHMAVNRPLEGGEKEFYKGVMHEESDVSNKPRGGIIGKLLPTGLGGRG